MDGSRTPLRSAFLLLIVSHVSVAQQLASCNNCCDKGNHIEIDNSRRSVLSQWTSGQTALCDMDLTQGWYRFTSFVGDKMPTTKVDINHCGTTSPIWLDGSTGNHPTSPDDPVVRIKACVNILERKGGCFSSFYVSVKNCAGGTGTFYIYFLQPAYSCFIAYCAGDGQPCPYGQTGTSLDTCSEGPQKFSSSLLGRPNITFKPLEEGQAVSLLCIVPLHQNIRNWKNVTYLIEWRTGDGVRNESRCLPEDNKPENTNGCPDDKEIHSVLYGSKGHYYPGQWISCSVRAKFTNSDAHPWSDPVDVLKPFFAGVKVTPSTIIIAECNDPYYTELTLTPTIPIGKNSRGEEYLSVTFYLPEGLWLKNDNKCSIKLKGTTPVKVKIAASCTWLYGHSKLKVITPFITNHDGVSFWTHIGLPKVWVTVIEKSKPVHKCSSVTDPHYRLFSDVTRWHDFHGLGDYVLYHNRERNFEVQTRQWACNNAKTISCNCGAVVRDHNSIIVFSCCGKPPRDKRDSTSPIEIDIPGSTCLSPGITLKQLIKGINSKYEVIVPSGIRVIIERNYWGIDVHIYTPRTEKPQDEEGLCTFKADGNEDFTTFGGRLRKLPSYFHQVPALNLKHSIAFETSCSCSRNTGKPPECVNGIKTVFAHTQLNPENLNRIKMCDSDVKREIKGSDDLTKEDYDLFRQARMPIEPRQRSRRSLSAVSKENATRYCAERLAETPVGKLCEKVGTNVQALVNVCSADIQFTGDFSFVIGAVSLLMNECVDAIVENITVNANDTTNVTMVIPVEVVQITELICPNDCTFNGKCVNGTCVCNKDFIADDCSMSVNQRPSIWRLQTEGLCDRRQRPCKKVSVLGSGFVNSTNLTCHIEEEKIVNSSWSPSTNTTKYPGIMTDLVIVECLLPESPVLRTQYDENVDGTPAAGLVISVSNNGIHESNEKLKLISFDSVCMECNVSTGCFLKKNVCFINRYCFAPNDSNPRNWCEQCIPEVTTSNWSKRQVNHPPNVTSKTDYYVVYGELLELPLEVSDTEGMPVTVSLGEGSPQGAVVLNKVLLWNVTTNKTTHFFLKATDACQASSTLNITITVNVCPCKNNGRCIPRNPRGQGFYSCGCAPGFTGPVCDAEIDECQSYPCVRGRCIDRLNNYTCSCDFGVEGRNCDVDIDFCKSSPCVNGNCTDKINGYACDCDPGYTGRACDAEINECASSPCAHGTCHDQVNGYRCQCESGYTGARCDVNIDECLSSPCLHGTCVDQVNSFTCTCQEGFNGTRCEVDINECLQVSCWNGSCIDQVNNYSCICNVGYTGRHCTTIITHCSNDSCYPGVRCTEISNTISCGNCPAGFTGNGKNCEDIDECANHTCANSGSCVDGVNNYSCSCVVGYTGDHCQTGQSIFEDTLLEVQKEGSTFPDIDCCHCPHGQFAASPQPHTPVMLVLPRAWNSKTKTYKTINFSL